AERKGISLLLAENRLRAVSRPVKTRTMPMMSSLRSSDMPAGGRGCCPRERGRGPGPLGRPLALPAPPLAGAGLPPLFGFASALPLGFLSCGLRKGLGNTSANPRGGIIARVSEGKSRQRTLATAIAAVAHLPRMQVPGSAGVERTEMIVTELNTHRVLARDV